MIFIAIKLQQHRKWWFYLRYQDFHPSSIRPRAGSQVWWRCQCGSALSAQAARTWSKQSPVKHHVQQRWYPLLSQIFLCFPQIPPFLLLHRVLGELSRFCRSVSSLPGVFVWPCLWAGDGGHVEFFAEKTCSAPANMLRAISEWFKARISPLAHFYDSQRWSDRCCHLWRSEMLPFVT